MRMRILLSAYSCDPNLGSEAAIGWNWLVTLARLGHEVLLLCRTVDAPGIRAGLADRPERERITILTYDPPWFPTRAKTTDRFIRFHCLLWQIGAYFSLRRRIRDLRPDVIQHITWGVCRLPCLLSLLGVPTVFGPVGGGETAPFRLRHKFSLRAHVFELLRDGLNRLVAVDPLMWLTFSHSALIAVRTDETRRFIPRRFHGKIFKHTGLTIDRSELESAPAPVIAETRRPLRLLFVGRLLHWKGIYYVMAAYRRFLEISPEAELTIVGQGSGGADLRRQAAKLGVDHRIRWISSVEHSKVHELYRAHDVFLFPSLHDSGGMVVLEALTNGLPVIALDLGGPAEIADDSCGRIVRTARLRPQEVIERLVDCLEELSDPALRARLSKGAQRRAADFISERSIGGFYEVVQSVIGLPERTASAVRQPVRLDKDAVKERART